jgi:hypothetical protein
MKDKLNGNYRVKWDSDAFYNTIGASIFTYSIRGPLTKRFTDICELIVSYIVSEGHVPIVDAMEANNGVIITERYPNSVTVKFHWVWIERDD